MFSIDTKTENGFDKIILKDESNGTFAEIIPSCSAILHAFTIIHDGELNVIESYENAEDFKKNVTSKGFLGTKLSPFVCRINKGKYRFEGKEFTIEKYYDRNNALHGMLYDQPFKVFGHQSNENSAAVSMIHEYRATDPGYPFNYDCIVTYELEKHNRLNVFTQVVNKDSGSIPVQDGWHPYFKLDAKIDDLKLQFRSFEMVEFNEELIPTGKLISYKEFDTLKELGNTFLDNCFTLNFSEGQPICLLQDTGKKIEIEIHADESYPYLQFYTPPHRNSIAIENISGAPDAFNNGMGLKTLSPGESATFECSYKISLLI
ncbi:MAG: Aldose 1-epimerase [Chitinophagaceae bacterium]|nr:Aldose 1-epimerase [Chitinophagaceae bacterium]